MFPRTTETAFARFQSKGEARALAIVFDRTAPELLRVARHLAPSPADAEDLVQATFLTAIESRATHQKGKPVLPWLLGILSNHARSARRRGRRRLDPARLRAEVVADVDADVAAAELQRELAAAIGELSEVYRPVLRLWFEHGLEAQEIAATLERPAGTVRAQISRGVEMLRRALPPSLAGATAVAVATGSGLAAVRTKVLASAGAVAGTSSGLASTLVIGGLLMLHHKLITAGAVAAVALLSWLTFHTPAEAVPIEPEPRDRVVAAAGGIENRASEVPVDPVVRTEVDSPAEHRVPEEPPAPALSTALVVRLRSAGDGSALPGYGVALRAGGELQSFASPVTFLTTDELGVARFAELLPGQYYVEVDRLGVVGVTVAVEGETGEHVVDVPDSVTVVGQVLYPNGQPVLGADVVVQGSRLASPRVAVTDALGRFEVRHVHNVEVQARKAGFSPSLAHFVQGQPHERVELELTLRAGGRRIMGRALDPDGRPVADAAVAIVPASIRQLTPWDREKPQPRPLWLRTAADGTFATDEAGAGEYLVVVRPADLEIAPSWAVADTTNGDAHVELRSELATVVAGTVRQGDEPLAGVRITAWPEQCAAEIGYLLNLVGMRTAETDARGAFRILGTLPGELTISAYRGMELLGQVRRVVKAGETARWDLDVGESSELAIHVETPRALPPRTMAFVYDLEAPNTAPGIVPFRQGKATYTGRRPGAVRVVVGVLAGGRSLIQLAQQDVEPGAAEVRLALAEEQLPRHSIRGRLVDAAMAPVARKTMAARRSADGLVVSVEAVTSADGVFEIGPLPPGRYRLWAGEMTTAVPVGEVVLTTSGDEDAGDVKL